MSKVECPKCHKVVQSAHNLRIHDRMVHYVEPVAAEATAEKVTSQVVTLSAPVATLAAPEQAELALLRDFKTQADAELAQLRELRDGWQVAVATPENFATLAESLGYGKPSPPTGGNDKPAETPKAPLTRMERIGAALLEERKGLLAFCFKRLVTALGPADEGYDWAMDNEPSYGGIRVIQVQRTTHAQSTPFGNTRFKGGVFCDLVDFAVRAIEIYSQRRKGA